MIVLDTTVLIYAVGAEHPLQSPCRQLIELIGSGQVNATTTIEVIQEFVHVRARRRTRDDAAHLGEQFAVLLAPLLRPDGADLASGLRLFRAQGHDLGAFDAVLAATSSRTGARALVSADRAFADVLGKKRRVEVRNLRHLDPASPDFLDAVQAV